jgi:hypothetical protein
MPDYPRANKPAVSLAKRELFIFRFSINMDLSLPSEPLLKLKLNSGRGITAKTLHVSHTYEGLLEGTPTDEWNQSLLSDLPRRLTRIFGDWPIHIIPPGMKRKEESFAGRKRIASFMPPLEFAAFFICYQPVNPKMHASGLVIVWHEWSPTPFMSPDTRAQVEKIRWEDYAKDFEW